MVTTQRGTGIPQRPMEVQRGRMDLDGWVERGQPEGDVRDSGHGCRGQHSWGAIHGLILGPTRREISGSSVGPVIPQGGLTRVTERPMEVQRGRVDVDGRVERVQPGWDIRDPGYGCGVQHSWGASRIDFLDRRSRKSLAVWRGWFPLGGEVTDYSTTCGSTSHKM